jgi:hypothetical protein
MDNFSTDGAGNKKPGKGSFILLNENFDAREVTLDDLKVTGRQLAEAAGYHSAEEVIVLQQLSNGSIAEIRSEELVALDTPGVERFFVMEGDRTFRFIVDGLKLEWPRASIGAKSIRKLALKDESFDVIQELAEVPDRMLDEEEIVSLKGDGTERFKTKGGAKLVTVYYGETAYELPKGSYTTEQLMATFAVESGYLLDLIEDGKLVELKPGEKTRLKNEMHFTSHPPRGQSS